MFVAKRDLGCNRVRGFGKEKVWGFRFYLLAILLGSQGALFACDFSLAAHVGHPERLQEVEDGWVLVWWPQSQELAMVKGLSGKLPASTRDLGRASPAACGSPAEPASPPTLPLPPVSMPLSALPEPATGGQDRVVSPPRVPR